MAAKVHKNAFGFYLDRVIVYGEGYAVPDLETSDLGHKTYMETAASAGQAPGCAEYHSGVLEALVPQIR
ncbi:hypothetical protein D1872_325590 [compost metagenome]